MNKTESYPTSRQRVRESLSHKQPDKIVIDFDSEVVFWGGGCDTRNILNLGTPGFSAKYRCYV